MIITLVDAITCILAGFAIFATLGYIAVNQGKDVEDVIKEGRLTVIMMFYEIPSK